MNVKLKYQSEIINDRNQLIRFLVKYMVKFPNLAELEGKESFVKFVFENSIAGKYPCLTSEDIGELRALPTFFLKGMMDGKYFFNEDGFMEYRDSMSSKGNLSKRG